jgi:hypothetical protein
MTRKPKNPSHANPFQGIQDANRGFLVAQTTFTGLKNIERYSSKDSAEKGVMKKHGRNVKWG